MKLTKPYVIENKIIEEGSEIVFSTFMESFLKDIQKSKEQIHKLLKEYDINFVFIGGIARNEYTRPKTTEDIDILVAKEDKNKIKSIPIGFMRDISGNGKIFNFHGNSENVRLEVLYSGEKAGNENGVEYVDPEIVMDIHRDSLPYLSLTSLIMYKLASGIYGGRMKDFGDIQELIKYNNLPRDYADGFREDLKNKYNEIWDFAQGEVL